MKDSQRRLAFGLTSFTVGALCCLIPYSGTSAEYKQNTFSIKPLTLNISTMTIGYHKKNAFIDGKKVDPYRSNFGTVFHRGDRTGAGYDLELGYFVVNNIELFTMLTYIHERGNKINALAHGDTNFGYHFKRRKDTAISLGGRYFWTINESKWLPFAGLMGTLTSQGATKANIANITLFSPGPAVNLGDFKLQKHRTLWGGMLQGGADYRINDTFALTLSVGAQYTTRGKRTITPIPGFIPVNYKDKYSHWTFPLQVSLRITF